MRILIDMTSIEAIKESEKVKISLESKGYNLKSTRSIGFDMYELIYEKEVKNEA